MIAYSDRGQVGAIMTNAIPKILRRHLGYKSTSKHGLIIVPI